MTALDKAFIKAYSQDEPHRHVPRPHFAIRQDAAQRREAARDAADAVVAETRSAHVLNGAAPAGGQTFAPLSHLSQTLFEDGAIANAGNISPTSAIHPLAVFGVPGHEEPPSVTKIPFAQPNQVRPSFEVDHVVWPNFCQIHSADIGDGLDAVVNEFARAEVGRTRTVGLAGTTPGAGCTTIAMTLAYHLCQQRSVAQVAELLLVDADLQNTELAQRLGLAPQACWIEMAEQGVALDDALIESLDDRMVVMPIGDRRNRTAAQPLGQRLSQDLATLTEQYRTVLVDLGPIETARDSGMLAAMAGCLDTLLLVHDVRQSDHAAIDQATAIAQRSDLEVAGVIENFSTQNN